MKLFLILLMSIFLYGDNLDDILKSVDKKSPDYNFDIVLVKKIKQLSFITPTIKGKLYLDKFYSLVDLEKSYQNLDFKISELQDKVDILKNNKTQTAKLQTIYYQKLIDIYNKELKFFNDNFDFLEESVFKELKNEKFDINLAQKNLDYWQKLLLDKQKEYEKLNINLQKWILLENNENIITTKKYIQFNLEKQQQIFKKLLDNQLTIWFFQLKTKDKKALNSDDLILTYSKKIDKNFYLSMNQIIVDFEKYIFGSKMLIYGAKQEVEVTWQSFLKIINYPLFNVSGRNISPINFVIFIFVLIFGVFIGKYYKNLIYKLKERNNISYSTATLLANMGYYTILTFSFLMALKVIGLDLSSLAIVAGALSVGIGFGLQNVVSNFVSGIILMFERTIKVGDYIQIDNDTRGEVVDISMRSTIIRTNDNINLIIPNQSFIQNNVINWTLGDDFVRFRVPFGVAYGTNIDEVEKVVLNGLKNSNLPYIKQHKKLDITPRVIFMEMADSSLNFELFIWVKGEYARRPRRTRSKFLKMIYNELNKAKISIPFPQQDIYIKEIGEIKIKKD